MFLFIVQNISTCSLFIQEEADKEKNEILNRLEQLQSAHSQEVSSLKTELEGSQAKSKEAAERVQSLEEELGEKMSEVKIVEKKSSALVRVDKWEWLCHACYKILLKTERYFSVFFLPV